MRLTGGCHCGRLRYVVEGELIEAGYCHCHICRQTTGAPMLAFASFAVDGFRYSHGEPAIYISSPRGRREYCRDCGAQICHRALEPVTIDINAGTLDSPELVAPQFHIHTRDALPWLLLDDGLPRYRRGRTSGQPDAE